MILHSIMKNGKIDTGAYLEKQPPEVFYKKKLFWKVSQYSQGITCNQACKKKNSAEMFSCEYCEIVKNIYFEQYLRMAASVFRIEFQISMMETF